MRKTKTIKHKTPDPLAGMTPDQTADALSALESLGGYQVDYNPSDLKDQLDQLRDGLLNRSIQTMPNTTPYIGDPPNTLGPGGVYPYPGTFPSGTIIGTTTLSSEGVSISELLDKINKLEQQVAELATEIKELRRQGHGFKRKKNI